MAEQGPYRTAATTIAPTRISPNLVQKRFFVCPSCSNHSMDIEDLFEILNDPSLGYSKLGRCAGIRVCDCGVEWHVICLADGTVSVERTPANLRRQQFSVLRISPQSEPIHLIVRGYRWQEKADEDTDRFFYEENQCPENYFRAACGVFCGLNSDPHGLAKLVGSFDSEQAAKDFLLSETK